MTFKPLEKLIEKAVKRYFSTLEESKFVPIAVKVMGAQGLTEENYKRLVETATGEKHVSIYFSDGSAAEISNVKNTTKGGPGW